MAFIIWILLVESKCYVLDLAQSTKTWETFPELPQPCAYPAMVYNEKVNRLYVVSCENERNDEHPWVSSLKASSISLLYEVLYDLVNYSMMLFLFRGEHMCTISLVLDLTLALGRMRLKIVVIPSVN